MGSKAGSSIGTFLMSLPVSAILLMAVFGVPSFSPGVGGQSGWQNAKDLFTNLTRGNEQAPPDTSTHPFAQNAPGHPGIAGPTAASEAPAWGDAGSTDSLAATAWPPSSEAPRSQFDEPQRPAGTADSFSRHPLVSHSSGGDSDEAASITWKQARLRLAELGIDRFHLEPGLDGDDFLFVCLLTPGGNPNVTRRFEAEATEPLAAVQNVLQQIEGWLAQQYANQSQFDAAPHQHR